MESVKESILDMIKHYEKALSYLENINIEHDYSNQEIIIVGMGGSGIGGMILEWIFEEVKIRSWNHKILPPKYKDSKIILVSYSGNTSETLKIYDNHKENVIGVVTSGGLLEKRAKIDKIPIVYLPRGMAPRASLPYILLAISRILLVNRIVTTKQIQLIKRVISNLKEEFDNIKKYANDVSNLITQNHIIIFLSPYELYPAAYRSKTQINENCKMHSYSEYLSEHNHNSILSLKQKHRDIFYIIYDFPDKEYRKRIEFLTKELLKTNHRFEIISLGNNKKTDLLFQYIAFGDLLSIFVAKNLYVNPDSIDLIENLKKYLSKDV